MYMNKTEMFAEKEGREWGEQNQPQESAVLMERKKKKDTKLLYYNEKATRFHSIK